MALFGSRKWDLTYGDLQISYFLSGSKEEIGDWCVMSRGVEMIGEYIYINNIDQVNIYLFMFIYTHKGQWYMFARWKRRIKQGYGTSIILRKKEFYILHSKKSKLFTGHTCSVVCSIFHRIFKSIHLFKGV